MAISVSGDRRLRFAVPMGNTWGFALLVGTAVTATGLAVDFALKGRGFPAPSWPDNGIWLALCLFFQGAVWHFSRGTRLFAGLSGGRLAVVTIGLIAIWAVFLGSFPQVVRGESALIFQRVMHAPPFVFLLLLLLANLGWGILKHLGEGLRPSSLFLFNHIGVYVVGAAALFGSGDVVRLDIWVKEGEMAWTGTDGRHSYEMPFAIDLHRFTIEYFPPQLTIIDSSTGEILVPRGKDPLTLRPGKTADFMGYRVEVREVTQAAPWSVPGDPVPAAHIKVIGPAGEEGEGWVSSGSYIMPPVFVGAGDVSFAMPVPRARLYESRFTLVEPEGEPLEKSVRVNEPVKVAGWWLYQKGYNLEGGPRDRWSQIEAVRDPWLPAVYTGFALMALGGILALARAGSLLRLWKQNHLRNAP